MTAPRRHLHQHMHLGLRSRGQAIQDMIDRLVAATERDEIVWDHHSQQVFHLWHERVLLVMIAGVLPLLRFYTCPDPPPERSAELHLAQAGCAISCSTTRSQRRALGRAVQDQRRRQRQQAPTPREIELQREQALLDRLAPPV